MPETTQEWHQRYVQQTRWTSNLASFLFQRAGFTASTQVLEVGCGTAAVYQELIKPLNSTYFGLDINPTYLTFAAQTIPKNRLVQGDAHYLPLIEHCFDACICHYLLLWVADPFLVIQQMQRVTRPGGVVLALAEPDYGGRIDYPQELSVLGKWQMDSLHQQGADPLLGRKLRALFSSCGLLSVEVGVLGGVWKINGEADSSESEWDILQADLANDAEKLAQLPRLHKVDALSLERGERILYVPTFYACGHVP